MLKRRKEESLAARQGQPSFTVYVASTDPTLTVESQMMNSRKRKFKHVLMVKMKCHATLVSSSPQTLTASRYFHETWFLMSDLISNLYNIMSGVKYNKMMCQSARQGRKKWPLMVPTKTPVSGATGPWQTDYTIFNHFHWDFVVVTVIPTVES